MEQLIRDAFNREYPNGLAVGAGIMTEAFYEVYRKGWLAANEHEAISFIQESFCFDSYEEARDYWLETLKQRKHDREMAGRHLEWERGREGVWYDAPAS